MIKNRTIIEVELNGREFRLECASESTFQEVTQVISMLQSYVTERIKAIDEQKKVEEPKVE